jgi:hypothetical protein
MTLIFASKTIAPNGILFWINSNILFIILPFNSAISPQRSAFIKKGRTKDRVGRHAELVCKLRIQLFADS